MILLATAPSFALSTTFTVTNSGDAGDGTLRKAILDANGSAGPDTVQFSIPGVGPHSLSPLSALPSITDPLLIDGYTQPGAVANSMAIGTDAILKVELTGASAGSGVDGLYVGVGGSAIRGLAINGFGGDGVEIGTGDSSRVEGCYIGTNVAGTSALANSAIGVRVTGGAGNLIGGALSAARNVISGGNFQGILVEAAAAGTIIQGNYIGTTADGLSALGNFASGVRINGPGAIVGGVTPAFRNVISGNGAGGLAYGLEFHPGSAGSVAEGNSVGTDATGASMLGNNGGGILIYTSGVTVGGTTTGAGNVISSNTSVGIILAGSGNFVWGNFIGTDETETVDLGNGGSGIEIGIVDDNQVGALSTGAGNAILHNGGNGISVIGLCSGISILSNRINSNAGLGIDLDADGTTSNDPGDGDTGANGRQNFPVLDSAVSRSVTRVFGSLNSSPNTAYVLQFFSNPFCDASGNGEGANLVGTDTVMTDGSGNVTFSAYFSIGIPAGSVISATATDPTGNTSEFSECAVVTTPAGILPGEGVEISQIDFTFTNATQANSRYGLLAVDIPALTSATGISSGYLNVVTDQGWVVRNMPIDTISQLPGLSAMFDLGSATEFTSLAAFIDFSATPVVSFSGVPVDTLFVGAIPYNAEGSGILRNVIPAAIDLLDLIFSPGGLTDAIWPAPRENVAQDQNQCGPASVANSLRWLQTEYGIEVPNTHEPGIGDNPPSAPTLVGELDKKMNRPPHEPVASAQDFINGKVGYIDENDLGDEIVLKHKSRPGVNWIDGDQTVGEATSTQDMTPGLSLIDWILQELAHGEDVEIRIGWDPDGSSGHFVDLIGGGHVLGVPWISWIHDANQGYDDNGTEEDDTDDVTDENNGGIGAKTGGVGWSPVIGDRILVFIGGEFLTGTIDFATSESPKPSLILDWLLSLIPGTFFSESEWTRNGVPIGSSYVDGYVPTTGTPIFEEVEILGIPNDWHWYVDFTWSTNPVRDSVSVTGFLPDQEITVDVPYCDGRSLVHLEVDMATDSYTLLDEARIPFFAGQWSLYPADLPSECVATGIIRRNFRPASCVDTDGDGFGDPGNPENTCPNDNCPLVFNATQEDADGDGVGDLCDNCPSIPNTAQTDLDSNGVGDVCECLCPSQADLDGSAFVDAVDLAFLIDVVFFGAPDVQDPTCPRSRSDFNGDGISDAVDLAFLIDHIFFGGAGPENPCSP